MEMALPRQNMVTRSVLLNIVGIAFVYLAPTLSHFFAAPVYYLEPMRLMVILGLVHTNRTNAVIMSLTLPAFSFFISSHPVFLKASLISVELLVNVLVFVWLSKKMKEIAVAAFLSILASKLFYYAVKAVLLSSALLEGSLVSTPVLVQVMMTLIFSAYVYQMLGKKTE